MKSLFLVQPISATVHSLQTKCSPWNPWSLECDSGSSCFEQECAIPVKVKCFRKHWALSKTKTETSR